MRPVPRRLRRWAGPALAWVLAAAAAAPSAQIPRLLDALKTATSAEQSGRIEAALTEAWHDAASPSVQLLEDHAVEQAHSGKMQVALDDCDAALTLAPDQPDLYRRRAEVRFSLGDERGAFADLAQALSREPRMVPALVDLSRFAEARHDNARALEAWRRVLALDPSTEGGKARLQKLQQKVNGQPI